MPKVSLPTSGLLHGGMQNTSCGHLQVPFYRPAGSVLHEAVSRGADSPKHNLQIVGFLLHGEEKPAWIQSKLIVVAYLLLV